MASFVHLRTHSQYSILDASAPIPDLAEKAASLGMPALALTDHGNLFGAVDFYKACKEAKVKPILGCELYVAPGSRFEKSKVIGQRAAYHLTLLAKNKQGYHHLCKLSSAGYLDGFYYYPRVDADLLQQFSEGLICLTGSLGTRLAQEILQGTSETVLQQLEWCKAVFKDNLYLDLQRYQMSESDLQADGMYQESWLLQQYQDFIGRQEKVNAALLALSQEHGIPLVATNDVHYMDREDWRAHEILLNIQSGEPCEIWEKDSQGNPKFRVANPKRQTYPSHEYYFKTSEQMEALFSDVPQALANTVAISEQCYVEIDFKTKHYPVYIPPQLEGKVYTKEEQSRAVEEFLWQLCEEGIPKRYTAERLAKVKEIYPDKEPMDVVRERLNYEMSIIVPKGMSDYLLIVWDFINWAKRSGIPMGPGRGSGAGSIVLYLIGITDIEPLRFHLFFERFINPERISYPDIDVDICMDRRGEVIAYTLQKYGKDNVAQIITFGTMKAKMTIKDVGRVLSVPLSRVNEIAKLVPEDLNITLEKALEKDPELRQLYETDEEVARLFNLGRRLEGSIRNTGIHAAGIIISGQPLTNLIPICTAKDSEMPVTQFSMKPVEAVGMLKVDFLGLKTLTAIQTCVDSIKSNTGKEIDWINLPLDDKPTFDLLNQGKTLGIFQLESAGMQDLARQLHLDRFEEIIAVGALYRPGPMDMIPSFINRKHGREIIENDHPWMKDILAETYGIMVYQEQVMQIASKLANFSLGEGDVLRRAMGKKDMDQMAKQREKFRLGALQNGINEETSMLIFDKMEKFAAYGFNKSHAAAYGYLSYVTAYMKANYPREWMAALMTCDRDDISKIAKFIRECQTMNIKVLPPDINEAGEIFQATAQGIRFAMTGIKGVGAGVVEAIVQERKKGGPFSSLYQFFKRMDTKKVGKKVVESLVEAGCFDFTGWSRDALIQSIDPIFEAVSKDQKENALGIISLFSLMGETSESKFSTPPTVKNRTSKQDVLRKEKELLGFFLTGHPMDEYKNILQRLSCVPLRRIDEMDHDHIFRSAFIVESIQTRLSAKSQRKFAILVISDGIERQELPVWSDLYEEKSHLLKENQLLYAVLQVDKRETETRLSCKWLADLTKADEAMMEECDRAYDKAKHQAAKFAQSKNAAAKNGEKEKGKGMNGAEKQPVVQKVKTLHIKMDIDQARLSHVLALKQVFTTHVGTTPVQIFFQKGGASLATLHIDSKWGVAFDDGVKKQIERVASVLSIDLA
jgi:DNA polymerase III subunit alpha